jgi:aconitate hydratase
MPAGAYLKYRSNIPVYAKYVFECFNESGKPTFAERAAAVRDSGRAGIIVAAESYGQGSSREHAAICPMYLGVRCIIALSIERIHAANLLNFGIVPLYFDSASELDKIEQGDTIRIDGIHGQMKAGTAVKATVVKADGSKTALNLHHNLSAEDVALVLKGGRLA